MVIFELNEILFKSTKQIGKYHMCIFKKYDDRKCKVWLHINIVGGEYNFCINCIALAFIWVRLSFLFNVQENFYTAYLKRNIWTKHSLIKSVFKTNQNISNQLVGIVSHGW